MKRYGLLIVLVMIISSFFDVRGISAYLVSSTNPENNTFLVKDTTTYTVVHRQMNLDGTTYTVVSQTNYEVPIGTTVSPAVNTYTGFVTPAVQTVTLNSFTNTVITYTYDRVLCHLTITDSQYVTTSTPTGDYYYGTEIHLVADEYNATSNPFVKWTNNVSNRDYTFAITADTTIGPIYVISYTITYVPNNGDSSTTQQVIEHNPITTFPVVEYNDCGSGTGTYQQLGCTYVYEFLGWYRESTFVNKVDETFVPTADTTLYAKWNKIYFHNDLTVFDGTNYLDTEMTLFSTENARKDFIVTFNFDAMGSSAEPIQLLFTDMREGTAPYPGVSFKYTVSSGKYELVANVAAGSGVGAKVTTTLTGFSVGDDVVLKRENGLFYYSTDGGSTFTFLNDFSNFNLFHNFHAVFGAGYMDENVTIYRKFTGTLSNMTVELIKPDSYTIHYDANGGSGVMPDQNIELGTNTNLVSNNFVNGDAAFNGWNTQPDGSGTSYINNYAIISDLGNAGDVITLYAQWILPDYHVAFDSNGGTGTMTPQGFMFGVGQDLRSSNFTKTGYIFEKWNTQPDGTGTSYDDKEFVTDLTNVQNSTVILYAIYEKIEFEQGGVTTFSGTDCLDTGVNLYTVNTINKDFDLVFTVTEVDATFNATGNLQRTIMNSKDESNSKYPGFVVRFNRNEATPIRTAARWSNSSSNIASTVASSNVPVTFRFKRRDGVVYLSYSYEGYDSGWILQYNQANWNLNSYFPTNITFGAAYINGNPDRFFKGSVRDIQIAVAE